MIWPRQQPHKKRHRPRKPLLSELGLLRLSAKELRLLKLGGRGPSKKQSRKKMLKKRKQLNELLLLSEPRLLRLSAKELGRVMLSSVGSWRKGMLQKARLHEPQ